MLLHIFIGELDVGMGQRLGVDFRHPVMVPRVAQELTIKGTIDGLLTLRAAARRANLLIQRRAGAPRRAGFAEGAGGTFQTCYRTIRSVKSIDVYIKVEVDLNETEHPKKFAEELCRILKKVYGVRKAEINNIQDVNEQ